MPKIIKEYVCDNCGLVESHPFLSLRPGEQSWMLARIDEPNTKHVCSVECARAMNAKIEAKMEQPK